MISSVLNVTAEEFDGFEAPAREELPSKDFFHVGFFWHKGKVWAVPVRLFDEFEAKSWQMMMPIRQAFRFMDILAASGADCVCIERVEAKKLGIDIQKLISLSQVCQDLDRREQDRCMTHDFDANEESNDQNEADNVVHLVKEPGA